jgi:hypothetical protein
MPRQHATYDSKHDEDENKVKAVGHNIFQDLVGNTVGKANKIDSETKMD